MTWTLNRTHQLSVPSREGLAALVRALEPRARVVGCRRLGGGLMTATHAIDLRTTNGSVLPIVLKRYAPDDHSAPAEWSRLRFASRLPVPTPDPLALDRSGAWFGLPALVMRRLPGRADLEPSRPDRFFRQIAEAHVAIQATSTARAPAAIRNSWPAAEWRPPPGLRQTPLVEQAIDVVRRERAAALAAEPTFVHGDLHPGNLLWSRARLTGITDWRSAKIAPRAFEVAYTRADLAVVLGLWAADRFLETYEEVWGAPVEHLRVWDITQGLSAMCWGHYWALAYREQGRRDLTDALARRRARAFVGRALARM